MGKRRVVVTGMGIVSPVGRSVDAFWSSLVSGKSGISYLEDPEFAQFGTRIAGRIHEYTVPQFLKGRKEVRNWDRSILFAVDAAFQAISNAGLPQRLSNGPRAGVYIGSGIGGLETLSRGSERLYGERKTRVSPYLIPMMITNMASGVVAIETGAQGPSGSIVSACASSNSAIGESFWAIKNNRADIMLAGGTEAPITPLSMAGFSSMKAMSTRNDEPEKASRPFDLQRDGFVMGEGAGILVLEELEHARERGADILVELTGYGVSSDAHHLTAPDPEGRGACQAMRLAVEEAGIEPNQLDYINAHGTGTPLGDKAETLAIKRLIGEGKLAPPISSTKSATGHLFGGAGGIEAVAVIQTILTSILPPTLNLENDDPDCDLDYVPGEARPHSVSHALSNGFGFGGHNASLLFSRFSNTCKGFC